MIRSPDKPYFFFSFPDLGIQLIARSLKVFSFLSSFDYIVCLGFILFALIGGHGNSHNLITLPQLLNLRYTFVEFTSMSIKWFKNEIQYTGVYCIARYIGGHSIRWYGTELRKHLNLAGLIFNRSMPDCQELLPYSITVCTCTHVHCFSYSHLNICFSESQDLICSLSISLCTPISRDRSVMA